MVEPSARIVGYEALQTAGASLTDLLTQAAKDGQQLLEENVDYILEHGRPSREIDKQVLEVFEYISSLTQTALALPTLFKEV